MAKKILIIEDEELLADLLQKKLTAAGYKTFLATDGERGLIAMRELAPDLILLDIVMPKINGLEVLAEIREDKNLKKIPVIIISNSGQPVEIDKIKELGARDWLIKTDLNLQEVIDKVRRQIGS